MEKSKATIVIEIPEELLGETYTYESGGRHHPSVTLINRYAEIFINSDGRPEELGKSILDFLTRTEVPEDSIDFIERVIYYTVAEGSCKIIGEPLYSKVKDNWNDCKPRFFSSVPEINEDYQYLFSNEEWYVRSEVDESLYDFKKLSEVVNTEE
jgi:hypothetical protein